MRNPDKYIRRYFTETLDNIVVNGKTIRIYDSHSPNNDAPALIVMSTQSGFEVDKHKCNTSIDCDIIIDIITRYKPQFGSQTFADDIKEAVLVATENITIQNFTVTRVNIEFPPISPMTTSTESIFRKLIKYNFKLN